MGIIKDSMEAEDYNPLELPEEFLQGYGIYEKQIKQLILGKSNFHKREPKIYNLPETGDFYSVLDEVESAYICGGLEEADCRKLHEKYFSGKATPNDILKLRFYASVAYDKYGSEVMSFCLSLPKLPFRAVNAKKLFHQLDARDDDKPFVRLVYKDKDGRLQRVNMSYAKDVNGKINKQALDVVLRSSGEKLMSISRAGYVVPKSDLSSFIPTLQLFVTFNADLKEMMLNYGLETGECSHCGRLLRDPKSIARGIGARCAGLI
jgi:hypothetical protein